MSRPAEKIPGTDEVRISPRMWVLFNFSVSSFVIMFSSSRKVFFDNAFVGLASRDIIAISGLLGCGLYLVLEALFKVVSIFKFEFVEKCRARRFVIIFVYNSD